MHAEPAVPRSQTIPRAASAATKLREEADHSTPESFPGFAADANNAVMGQLNGLLTNPGSAGLPPGVIAGAHMHHRETRKHPDCASALVPCSTSNIHVPTSDSDGTVTYSNHGEGMPSHMHASVHSGGGLSLIHISEPTRPY